MADVTDRTWAREHLRAPSLSLNLTKNLVLVTFFIDLSLHGCVVFGWSSIDQIIKHENYFTTGSNDIVNGTSAAIIQSRISGQIFVLAIGLLGILFLLFGFVRDFVSFGIARIMLYVNLILSYSLIALATPTGCDNFIYAFILQVGSGIGILLSCLQFSLLYPSYQSLLVGIANTCVTVGSIMPQIWLQAITNTSITFTQIMMIWTCLATFSLILGLLFYPWHNLPDNSEITSEDLLALPMIIKKKLPLLKIGEYSTLPQMFRESASYLKSPMFYVHMFLFGIGNCMVTLTINVANDLMTNYNEAELEANQRTFEIYRVVISIVWGPSIGFMVDLFGKHVKSEPRDAKVMLLPMFVNLILYTLIVIMALLGANSSGTLWLMFVCLAISMTNIYVFETLGMYSIF